MAEALYKKWIAPDGLWKIQEWAKSGLTDTEIAAQIGVTRKTLYEWEKKYPEFKEALQRAKRQADDKVVGALYSRATGYTATVKKMQKIRTVKYDKLGKKVSETEELVPYEEEVHVPGDVNAQKFWLTNRDPENWKNHVEVDGAVGTGSLEEYIRSKGK